MAIKWTLKFENEKLSANKVIRESLGDISTSYFFPACWFLPKPSFWCWASGHWLLFPPGGLALEFFTWPLIFQSYPQGGQKSFTIPLKPSYGFDNNFLKVWKWQMGRTTLKALPAIFSGLTQDERECKTKAHLPRVLSWQFKNKKLTCQGDSLKLVCFYPHPE